MTEREGLSAENMAPCLCGRPVSIFHFYDQPVEAGAHINLQCTGDVKDECPLGLDITKDVESQAGVDAFLAAWNRRSEPIGASVPEGEEFLEFKEALSDLRALRHEYECLNGGGPGWSARNAAAWAKVDELFADEDEAAYDRRQEGFYG